MKLIPTKILVIQAVTFLGWWKRDPNSRVVGDLQLGDKKATSKNHMENFAFWL